MFRILAAAGAIAVDALPPTVIPPDLLGPSALLVASLLVVGVLWREDRRNRQERIDDLKALIVDLRAERDLNSGGWKAQTDANAKLAAAWEARNLAEDGRRRRSDSA